MKFIFTLSTYLFITLTACSQNVAYSKLQPFSNWVQAPVFDIIGKIKNNYIVHQFDKTHFLKIYNEDMELLKKVKLPFIPIIVNKRIPIDFITYSNCFYMFWQRVDGNTITFEAIKISDDGKLLTEVLTIAKVNFIKDDVDKSLTSFFCGIKWSEDKSKIAFHNFIADTSGLIIEVKLFDKELNNIEQNLIKIKDYDSQLDFFSNFLVTNYGDIIFARADKPIGLFLNNFQLLIKKRGAIELMNTDVPLTEISILLPKVKFDNEKNEILLNALYSNNKLPVIKGFYISKLAMQKNIVEAEGIKVIYHKTLKIDTTNTILGNYKFGFNKIELKKDGSLLLLVETTQRDLEYDDNHTNAFIPYKREIVPDLNIAPEYGVYGSSGYFSEVNNHMPLYNTGATTIEQPKKSYIFKDLKSYFTFIELNAMGDLKRDTTIEIVKNIKFTSQQVPYANRFDYNFFTHFNKNKSAGMMAFYKNLNEQYVLNKYEVINTNAFLNVAPIKAKYDYYFFDIAHAKQVELDKIIIPILRNNKLGFAKILF